MTLEKLIEEFESTKVCPAGGRWGTVTTLEGRFVCKVCKEPLVEVPEKKGLFEHP